eukprot:TRINITY_DN2959_c0_g1_i1.p2 TRINITY_DN2959_c0_g1~~TRINITY_DN2959_c0_g1_i1.p2  ORF type:complete len:113 (-),score=16.71 TRINITY_DN2959_c0_g1_i1:45-383(-)
MGETGNKPNTHQPFIIFISACAFSYWRKKKKERLEVFVFPCNCVFLSFLLLGLRVLKDGAARKRGEHKRRGVHLGRIVLASCVELGRRLARLAELGRAGGLEGEQQQQQQKP